MKPNPKLQALRTAWFDAPDLPAQKKLAGEMQVTGPEEPPFVPLGQYFMPYAYRSDLTGFVRAPITALWGVHRS